MQVGEGLAPALKVVDKMQRIRLGLIMATFGNR